MQIEMKGIDKSFGTNQVLKDAGFVLGHGEVHALMGENGAGKSTLMKILTGVYTKDKGTVIVDGQEVDYKNPQEAEKAGIVFIHQELNVLFDLTVEENICYVPGLESKMPKEEKKALARKMLEMVQLPEELASRFPRQLSGGQKQRVGIARAMAAEPDILLMDEPFGAVDEITRKGLQEELLALQQKTGITVVFITHDIGEAFKLGDRILIMKEGVIWQEGTGEELRRAPKDEFVRQLLCIP